MRRQPWDINRRRRANHAFAVRHASHRDLIGSIEDYLNSTTGYARRMWAMPRCVYAKRAN